MQDAGTVNGHTVAVDVPSNAVFTDTTYTAGTGIGISGTTISAKNTELSPYESNLQWGNTNIKGKVSCVGMAMSEDHNANRLALIDGDALTFEYSSDGGTTYTDYGFSKAYKTNFCTSNAYFSVGRPNSSTEYTLSSRTRVTLTAQNGQTGGY